MDGKILEDSLYEKVKRLEKENLELKKENKDLKKQLRKAKCCDNCANHSFYIPQVDRFVKGKDPEKCEDCKFSYLKKGNKKDNWECYKK